jgi:hypothetical protein
MKGSYGQFQLIDFNYQYVTFGEMFWWKKDIFCP